MRNDPSVFRQKKVILQSKKSQKEMLDSLHIQNYRLFKDLKIEKLGQVNLISGKNNCGKTALLEAIRLLESKFDNTVINNILFERGDYEVNQEDAYASLFRLYNPRQNWGIRFNDRYQIEYFSLEEPFRGKIGHYRIYDYDNEAVQKHTDKEEYVLDINLPPTHPNDKVVYIPFRDNNGSNAKLWSQIALTSKENDVIEILKILDNSIQKINFLGERSVVLTANMSRPIPLKNLGDGANRLLTIALGLVNAQNKVLLIDEFEIGLYHGIQEQLWEIIFKYAKEWNIQVFVTTHSLDTIRAFAEISAKFEGMGEYLRLQKSRTTDEIEAVIYSKKSLNYAIEDSLEMR